MKKKLLFVIPEYSHGGTNKSLENLLHFIDKDKYDISIFSLYEDGGSLYKDIFAPYVVKKSILYTLVHDNNVTRKIMGFIMKLSSKIDFDWLYKIEANRLQNKYNFDAIIAFQEGTATEFVSYIDKCNNKIAWIHFDYAMLKDETDLRTTKPYYDKFQHIVCVSKRAMLSMLSVYPEYKNKSTYLYNTINKKKINKQALQMSAIEYADDVFNILSVGRLVYAKKFDLIPKIVSKIQGLTEKGFCWYIIGDGEKKHEIEEEIKKYKVEDCVKLLGKKDNPYPYFKFANLHVCTSTHESFSYTIAEAKVLQTPVLSNDFPVAYEVVDASAGWICNINDMANMIADIINDKDGIYSHKCESIANYDYCNEAIMQGFNKLIDSVLC